MGEGKGIGLVLAGGGGKVPQYDLRFLVLL